jgi:peptidoglycan/xylan/chitin deacetylase (PgdA/CDA1 family)
MLRRAVERALVRSGIAARLARTGPGRRLVLAYHNVLPDDVAPDGDRSLHIARARFAEHLDLLAREARVVPLGQLLSPGPAGAGGGSRPLVAITFDDAYAGAVRTGVEELAARRLPATICVAPAFLDAGHFWWDALAGQTTDLDPEVREAALTQCRGDDEAARAWAAANGRQARTDFAWPYRCCTSAELNRALATPGITVASHTWRHRNIAALSLEQAREELERSFAWLRSHGDRAVPVVTWPYGLDSADARSLAAAAGYRAAFRVSGGAIGREADPFALPRLNVPAGLSADGLMLRLAGILGG